jgi:beta-glucosidase
MTPDVDTVLAALTLEQKVSLLAGRDSWHTNELPGVPSMRCSDGPAGVRGSDWRGPASASFPCGTALGASFDPGLVEEVGQALGREARSKSAHVLLAPTVNLHRTPIGGRNFECMSEDPILTSIIARAYVRGVQRERVACCIKHFVANDTEFERHTISSDVDAVTLRELYLVPFEHAVRPLHEGGADVRALMSSYNRINGVYASDHVELLRGVLRDEWGFDGVVFSDWYGTHSAALSMEASLDLEMPGPPRERGDALLAAVRAGATSEARVDEAVRRVLHLFDWAGVGDTGMDEVNDDAPATREVIRRAAIAGSVLLKNEGSILPLATTANIALLGPNAERGQVQGGGSARVRANRPSAPLPALQGRGVAVVHEAGCRIEKRLPSMRGSFEVRYHDAIGGSATALTERLSFVWPAAPMTGIDDATFAAHIAGTFTPDVDGDWTVGMTAVGPTVLRIDDEVIVDLSVPQTGGAYFGLGSQEIRVTLPCEAGVPRRVEIEMGTVERAQIRGLAVGAAAPATDDAMDRAVAAAAAADVAVVVVGTNADWETEGEDRLSMDLPGAQDDLVRRVAAANPRTVVVVNAGSPVTMPWLDDVAAVLQVWFPGEEFGEALADMLFGVAEPGGRLPVTMPKRLEDTPAFAHYPGAHDHMPYRERLFIGHRWYDAQGIEPLFPFGHGLGYTTWSMGDATVAGTTTSGVRIEVPVTNTGSRAGTTVVQCYVEPVERDDDRPVRTLQGFARVHAAAGATTSAVIELTAEAFRRWDPRGGRWVVPDGEHRLLVGWSSAVLSPAGVCRADGAV